MLTTYQSAINGIRVRAAHDKVAALAAIPGVVAVRPVLEAHRPDNTNGVPMVGAPGVWAGTPGFRGEGMKIAVIDTGVDYTHANFGGPGPSRRTTLRTRPTRPLPTRRTSGRRRRRSRAASTSSVTTTTPTGRLPSKVPHPDPNPLDCNGHGSHVAGTAAGFGVLGTGATYAGPYNASTVASNTWNVGPGVAPEADVYAIRVFGCLGSTNVTVDAIEWAVDNDVDVINMSLGSPLRPRRTHQPVASTNAAKAGVIVVTSAGNASAESRHHQRAGGRARGRSRRPRSTRPRRSRRATITTLSGPVTAIQRER